MNTESENTPVETSDDVDLDTFAKELFGQSDSAGGETTPEDVTDPTDEDDASIQDEDAVNNPEDEDTLAPADEDPDDEERAEEESAPPKKKNEVQERINEITSKYREEQRQRLALEERIAALEVSKQDPTPTPKIEEAKAGEPDPFAKNEDGSDKYPLGEYEPKVNKDLVSWQVSESLKALNTQQEQEKAKQESKTQADALVSEWNAKLEPARERYPDFSEKSQEFIGSIEGSIDPAYEDYLSAAIMNMDYGTDVLYYLASNPDEAKAIIAKGPTKATVALGRIEAKFAEAEAEKTLARPKASKAPPPPPSNKGASAARGVIKGDEDDLDAFTRELFKTK